MIDTNDVNDLSDLLERYQNTFKPILGVYSIYLFDFEKNKREYIILDSDHNQNTSIKFIKQVAPLLKDEDFSMLVADFKERIFINKTSEGHILMLTTKKKVVLGKILSLLKSII